MVYFGTMGQLYNTTSFLVVSTSFHSKMRKSVGNNEETTSLIGVTTCQHALIITPQFYQWRCPRPYFSTRPQDTHEKFWSEDKTMFERTKPAFLTLDNKLMLQVPAQYMHQSFKLASNIIESVFGRQPKTKVSTRSRFSHKINAVCTVHLNSTWDQCCSHACSW